MTLASNMILVKNFHEKCSYIILSRICAGSVNKLVSNQLYHSVAEVTLYKNKIKLELLTII